MWKLREETWFCRTFLWTHSVQEWPAHRLYYMIIQISSFLHLSTYLKSSAVHVYENNDACTALIKYILIEGWIQRIDLTDAYGYCYPSSWCWTEGDMNLRRTKCNEEYENVKHTVIFQPWDSEHLWNCSDLPFTSLTRAGCCNSSET